MKKAKTLPFLSYMCVFFFLCEQKLRMKKKKKGKGTGGNTTSKAHDAPIKEWGRGEETKLEKIIEAKKKNKTKQHEVESCDGEKRKK